MMTFNEKHNWVFHLAPTAFDYSKLDEYFGKLRKAEIGARQTHRDFGGNSAVRKGSGTENPTMLSKMEKSKAIISGMKDSIRNSLLRAGDTISGCSKTIPNIEKLGNCTI